MAKNSSIDISRSLSTGWLKRRRDTIDIISDVMDYAIFLMVSIFIGTAAIVLLTGFDYSYGFDQILGSLCAIVSVLAIYGIIRRLTQNKLSRIDTAFGKKQNREMLTTFLNDAGYEITENNNELIIVEDEESLSFNGLWKKIIIFIIDDNAVWFNVSKEYPKANPPVFFKHITLKRDLLKFFNSSLFRTVSPN